MRNRVVIFLLLMLFLLCIFGTASAQQFSMPKITVDLGGDGSPKTLSLSLQILAILTILAMAPSILIMMTSFTRIIIILSFLRYALGTQQIPPNQVLISFALFLTFLSMHPVIDEINNTALKPYKEGRITQEEAIATGFKPLRKFMLKQTRQKDIELFISAARIPPVKSAEDIPAVVLIPSFITSELKTAFEMGFALFVAFIIIDMVVASVLMSMGMFMVPPMMISLPFKILLFVLADGWYLLVGSILSSLR